MDSLPNQRSIFDYEYDVLREVLKSLDASKTANRTAYTQNIYWKMGFDTAYAIVERELDRGYKNGYMG